MGFYRGNKQVWMRSDSDVKEEKKKTTTYEDKQEMVDDSVDELRSKHGTKFTSLQYRVWAETILSGSHESLDDLLRGSFFLGVKVRVAKRLQVVT